MYDDVMMMHKIKTTRDFLVVVLPGCYNSTPLTMDLALEIHLMVRGRRLTIEISSLHVDPCDTTNKDSFSVLKSATPPTRGRCSRSSREHSGEQRTKVKVSKDKATPNFLGRSKDCIDPPVQCTRVNSKSRVG